MVLTGFTREEPKPREVAEQLELERRLLEAAQAGLGRLLPRAEKKP